MWWAGIALSVVVGLFGAAPAAAEGDVVLIDVDRNVFGNEGDVVQVAEVEVDPSLVGFTCIGTAQTENNASEHPDNDLILTSGGTTAEILDFERLAGQITSMDMELILGETVAASIRLGPHGIASEGLFIVLSCVSVQEPPPTTTTTTTQPPPPPPTTTTTTTTTQPPATTTTTTTQPPATTTTTTTLAPEASTTTEPPPEGGVEAGGGSTAAAQVDLAVVMVALGAMTLLGALAIATQSHRITTQCGRRRSSSN